MRKLGTFTQYRPTAEQVPAWLQGFPNLEQIVFARNAQGEDWYEVVKTLQPGRTLVVTMTGGYVTTVTRDYDQFPVPSGMSAYLLSAGEPVPVEGAYWSPETGTLPPPAPAIAPKLALVRAMRLVTLGGQRVYDTGQTPAWTYVQGALNAAPARVREDWALVTQVPRTDPVMLGLVQGLPWPSGVNPNAVIDQIYMLAEEIDRGEVDPYTGQKAA